MNNTTKAAAGEAVDVIEAPRLSQAELRQSATGDGGLVLQALCTDSAWITVWDEMECDVDGKVGKLRFVHLYSMQWYRDATSIDFLKQDAVVRQEALHNYRQLYGGINQQVPTAARDDYVSVYALRWHRSRNTNQYN